MKKITSVALVAVLSLGVAGCSIKTSIEPYGNNSSAKVETSQAFPFNVGDVSFDDFFTKVIDTNKSINYFRATMLNSVTVGDKTETKTVVMDVDQTNKDSVKIYGMGGSSDFIVIGERMWQREKDGWVDTSDSITDFSIYNPTSFFSGLEKNKDVINKTSYVGKEGEYHKFVITVDVDKIIKNGGNAFGDSDFTFLVDDQFRLVKQDMDFATSKDSRSHITIEYKDFDKPVNIVEPK